MASTTHVGTSLEPGLAASAQGVHNGTGRDARLLVEERMGESVSKYAGQSQQFRELNRYYLSLPPPLYGRENDRPVNSRSQDDPDLFVPRSFAMVEGAKPMWIFGVLGGHPPVRVYGRKPEWHETYEVLERLVTYDFDRAEVLSKSIHVASQMFKYGTGIAKIGYKYDSYFLQKEFEKTEITGLNDDGQPRHRTRVIKGEKEEVIRYDGPTLTPVSVYNFHPDPKFWDPKDFRFVCYDRWTDRETLRAENENYRRMTGKDLYKNLDAIPRSLKGTEGQNNQMDQDDDVAEAMGWTNTQGVAINKYTGQTQLNEESELVKITEYWAADDRVIYIANGETDILDGPNPYDDKEIPFIYARCHTLDNQFWGYGLLHPTQKSQEELNSLRNLNMRQAKLNILNVWAIDEASPLAQTATDFSPGEWIPVPFFQNGNPGIVPLFQGRPLPPEAYNYEDRVDNDMQTAIASPGYRSGGSGESGTATEANIEAERAQSRIRLQNLQGSLTYGAEIARLFISRRQQFLKEEGETIRILGADGVQFMNVTREDIAGEYDYIPGGQHIMPGKDVLRQQVLQLWALIGNNPQLGGMVKQGELLAETFKLMDFEYVEERFLNPPATENPLAKNPEMENMILRQGERIDATLPEDHQKHVQVHQQGLSEMIQNGDASPEGLNGMQSHLQQHMQFMEQAQQQQGAAQGGNPAQETPGLKGYEGNVPNMDNAVESDAGIQARLRGGGA